MCCKHLRLDTQWESINLRKAVSNGCVLQSLQILKTLEAHACNASYREAEIGRITVQDSPGQIVQGTPYPN
jgi:hypothetical protein